MDQCRYHCPKRMEDEFIITPEDAFMSRLTTGLRAPTARGPRFVLLYAVGKEGFVKIVKGTVSP